MLRLPDIRANRAVSRATPIYATAHNTLLLSLRDPIQAQQMRHMRNVQRIWTPHRMHEYNRHRARYSDIFHSRPHRQDRMEIGSILAFAV